MMRIALPGVVAATAIAVLTAAPAQAANAVLKATGGGAVTSYVDNGDRVHVCDQAKDGHGALGWISIQQANGSFKHAPRVYFGGGAYYCRIVTQDVVRETASMLITSCLVDGPNGTPFNCRSAGFSGR
jgi:hypothetical protein